jgi:hypothetical protein
MLHAIQSDALSVCLQTQSFFLSSFLASKWRNQITQWFLKEINLSLFSLMLLFGRSQKVHTRSWWSLTLNYLCISSFNADILYPPLIREKRNHILLTIIVWRLCVCRFRTHLKLLWVNNTSVEIVCCERKVTDYMTQEDVMEVAERDFIFEERCFLLCSCDLVRNTKEKVGLISLIGWSDTWHASFFLLRCWFSCLDFFCLNNMERETWMKESPRKLEQRQHDRHQHACFHVKLPFDE